MPRDPSISFVLHEAWLPPERLAAVRQLADADLAERRAGRSQAAASWFVPGADPPHGTGPALASTATAWLDDAITRLQPVLGRRPKACSWRAFDRTPTSDDYQRGDQRPAWLAIFYAGVTIRGRGGELLLETPGDPIPHRISPGANRLVVFPTRTRYRMAEHSGGLVALEIGFWDEAPAGD